MLIYKCDICENKYEASIVQGGIRYMDSSKLVTITNESDPCKNCTDEIKKAEEETKTRLKAKYGQTREEIKNVEH